MSSPAATVRSLGPDDLRAFQAAHPVGSYTLLDVRQPVEYEGGHLPGTTLLPLPELAEGPSKLDPEVPVVVYCAHGIRSSLAAQLLVSRGFVEVYNLAGGLVAWRGGLAGGAVAGSSERLSELARTMEQNTSAFYWTMAHSAQDPRAAETLKQLAHLEEGHVNEVEALALRLGLSPGEVDRSEPPLVEGGFDMDAFLARNQTAIGDGKTALEMAMALEAHALDLFSRLADSVDEPESRRLCLQFADEERHHMELLARMIDERHKSNASG